MKIREMNLFDKPREKLMYQGPNALSNSELVAAILGSGNKTNSALEISNRLLTSSSKGIGFLADCTPEELMSIDGIGHAKACMLLASVELGRRISKLPSASRPSIKSSSDIAQLFMERLRHENKEHFMTLMINAKGEVIEETEVSIGDLCSSQTHPREVFVNAVRRSAGSVAFVHNHPSGDPEPSQADIETTTRLVQVGDLLGIPVLDHIIIGDGTFVSLKARGLM